MGLCYLGIDNLMDFRNFFEMASFTLPYPIVVDGEVVDAVDMQFEKYPPTLNDSGRVMNQGSRFVARLPDGSAYLVYDGSGGASFVSDISDYIRLGFERVVGNWWKKAFFIKS